MFLDLHMPSPDGIELARQMRSSRFHRTTSIVLISDDQRPSALSVGFVAGASFFLYKSIDKDRLLKLVRATQGAMAHERRRTRRVYIPSKARFKFAEEELEGETIDVSMSGLLVRAPRTAPVGSSLGICLQLSARSVCGKSFGSSTRLRRKTDRLIERSSGRLIIAPRNGQAVIALKRFDHFFGNRSECSCGRTGIVAGFFEFCLEFAYRRAL